MEEKTRIGKTARTILLVASLAALTAIPTALILAHVTATIHFAGPQWCNTAGGCPWK